VWKEVGFQIKNFVSRTRARAVRSRRDGTFARGGVDSGETRRIDRTRGAGKEERLGDSCDQI